MTEQLPDELPGNEWDAEFDSEFDEFGSGEDESFQRMLQAG